VLHREVRPHVPVREREPRGTSWIRGECLGKGGHTARGALDPPGV
jgi:hypothetical protein